MRIYVCIATDRGRVFDFMQLEKVWVCFNAGKNGVG